MMNTPTPPQQTPRSKLIQQPASTQSKLFGYCLVSTQIGLMIAYGLLGPYYNDDPNIFYNQAFTVVALALFVLMGFGMVLSYYKFGNWIGMTTAIVVVILNIQLSPLMQKFWFSVIISHFGKLNIPSLVGNNVAQFWLRYSAIGLQASFQLTKNTFLSCISTLIFMTAVIGRLNINQIFKTAVIFQIFWSLNFFLLIYMCVIKQDHNLAARFSPFFFDRYGTTFNYLFAASFGASYIFFIINQPFKPHDPRKQTNNTSLIMSAIGTAFIFSTFVITNTDLIQYDKTTYENLSKFNIIWALTGSVIGTYAGSALVGRGKVGVKEALIGTITGGVIMGDAAPILNNIGLAIMIGLIGGLISGLYMRLVHPIINRKNVIDAMGLFGPFLISALLGSFVVTPSIISKWSSYVLQYYRQQPFAPYTIDTPYIPAALAGWQLVYVGISISVGIGSGVLAGLLSCCDRDNYAIGSNSRIFENDFGLYPPQSSFYMEEQKTPITNVEMNPLVLSGDKINQNGIQTQKQKVQLI